MGCIFSLALLIVESGLSLLEVRLEHSHLLLQVSNCGVGSLLCGGNLLLVRVELLSSFGGVDGGFLPRAFSSCEIEETGTGVNSTVEEGGLAPIGSEAIELRGSSHVNRYAINGRPNVPPGTSGGDDLLLRGRKGSFEVAHGAFQPLNFLLGLVQGHGEVLLLLFERLDFVGEVTVDVLVRHLHGIERGGDSGLGLIVRLLELQGGCFRHGDDFVP